ncbi:MAG TPA: GNAT family N-acetyltransferase [Gemmatimonadales bacterium]|nr:GNAT family N-acetyltransferase [Gemmatimonadales bacterium]
MRAVSQRVRAAGPDDAQTVLALIDALADYEKLPRPDAAARARLVEDGFGPAPRFHALIAEAGEPPVPIGYALYFETYSSFLARPTMYLEDLFVVPDARRGGHGIALFRALARVARARGCARMEWSVLKWNRLAIDFYDHLGAAPLSEWQPYRLEGEALERAAEG